MQWEKIQLKIFAGFEYSVELNGWNIKAWNSMNIFFLEIELCKMREKDNECRCGWNGFQLPTSQIKDYHCDVPKNPNQPNWIWLRCRFYITNKPYAIDSNERKPHNASRETSCAFSPTTFQAAKTIDRKREKDTSWF